MFARNARIEGFDPELAQAIANEATRQEDHVELIASENYTSPRVMEAQGSVLTNKYAEGYPGKRYYGGCEYVDVAEKLKHRDDDVPPPVNAAAQTPDGYADPGYGYGYDRPAREDGYQPAPQPQQPAMSGYSPVYGQVY